MKPDDIPLPTYSRGGMTIHHADCRTVLPTFADESFDFVLTDPPYLVNYRGRWDSKRTPIAGDDRDDWLRPTFAELWRVLKPDTFCVSFYGWPHCDRFVGVWKDLGFRPVSHLAFVKNVWGLGRFTRGKHETAFLLAKGRPPKPATGIADVIPWVRERNAAHPNQKPVHTLTPLLQTFAPAGGVVLDPFLGSGSTLRAAKDLGLRAVGIEIEERYCRHAAEREREWFTTAEAAELLGKAEFTVREWCRLGRIHAAKKRSGRGPAGEWTIGRAELSRIRDEGLLPDPRTYRHAP